MCGLWYQAPSARLPIKVEAKGKTTLNYIEVLPSSNTPSSSETDVVVPVKVITRAQAKAQNDVRRNETEPTPSEGTKKTKETWKARRARRAASRRKLNDKLKETAIETKAESVKTGEIQEPSEVNEKKQPAGSVLAEKHFEPLDALLQAYEARLKPFQTMEERWKNFPDPALEARQLELFKRLTEATQALAKQLEQPSLQPIEKQKETNELVEGVDLQSTPMPQKEMGNNKGTTKSETPLNRPIPIMIPNSSIPEVDEDWGNKLWEAVKQTQEPKKETSEVPPLKEVDFDQKTLELELQSEYGDVGSEKSGNSKAETLQTLPSYLGEYETKSDIKKLPSQKMSSPPTVDIPNLTALMSAPIKFTLPLAEVLKIKPELWKEVGKYLQKMGIDVPVTDIPTLHSDLAKQKYEPVPLNKVGDYCEGEDSNTTIPVEFRGQRTLAILDSGAGIAIATKKIWESWGKPAMRKTRMKLQLADGYIEKPIGLLEKVVVTSCGVEYEHTFAIVDFGKDPNYDIIMGRPFMRQLKMIQDWGFNYIYLRQQEAITRINLSNHSLRNVA